MTPDREIRRLPGGAIDAEFYLRQARVARSASAIGVLAALPAVLGRYVGRTARRYARRPAGRTRSDRGSAEGAR